MAVAPIWGTIKLLYDAQPLTETQWSWLDVNGDPLQTVIALGRASRKGGVVLASIQTKRATAILSLSALMGTSLMSVYPSSVFAAEGDPPPAAESEIVAKWDRDERTLQVGQQINAIVQINNNRPDGVEADVSAGDRQIVFTLENGLISAVPGECSPQRSSLSEDRKSLTCVSDAVQEEGSAKVIEVPVVVEGINGSRLTAFVTDEDNDRADLDPIAITAIEGLDAAIGSGRGSVEYQNSYMSATLGIMAPSGALMPNTDRPIVVELELGESGGGNLDVLLDRPDWLSGVNVRGVWSQSSESRVMANDQETFNQGIAPTVTARQKPGSPRILELTISDWAKIAAASADVNTFANGDPAGGNRMIMGNTLAFMIADKYHGTVSGAGTFTVRVRSVSYTSADGRAVSGASADVVATNNQSSGAYAVRGGWTGNNKTIPASALESIADLRNLWIGPYYDRATILTEQGKTVGAGWSGGVYVFPGQTHWDYHSIFGNFSPGQDVGSFCVINPSGQGRHFTGMVYGTGVIAGNARNVRVSYSTQQGNILGKACQDLTWSATPPSDPKQITAMKFDNLIADNSTNSLERNRADIQVQYVADTNVPAGRNFWSSAAWRSGFDAYKNEKVGTGVCTGNSYCTLAAYNTLPIDKPVYTTDYAGDQLPGAGEYLHLATVGSMYSQTNLYVEQGQDVGIGQPKGDAVVVNSGQVKTISGKRLTIATNAVSGSAKGQLKVTLPAGASYVPGSSKNLPGDPAISTEPGTGFPVLTWTDLPVESGRTEPFSIDVKFGGTGVKEIRSEFSIPLRNTNDTQLAAAKDSTSVNIISAGETTISKSVDDATLSLHWNQANSTWNITQKNMDARTQEVMDAIDVLPFDGDETVRPSNPTATTGQHVLTEIRAAAGTEVYLTTAAPETLVLDPADAKNSTGGQIGKPTAIWKRWDGQPGSVPGATGVRFISKNVGAGDVRKHHLGFKVSGSIKGDKFVNSVTSRATTTGLETREAAVAVTNDEPAPKLPVARKQLKTPYNEIAVRAGQVVQWEITQEIPREEAAAGRQFVIKDKLGNGFDNFKVISVSSGTFNGNTWTVGPYFPGNKFTALVQATIKKGFDPLDGNWINSLTNSVDLNDNACPEGDPTCNTLLENNNVIRVDKKRVDALGSTTPATAPLRAGDKIFYMVEAMADPGEQATIATDVVVDDLGDVAGGTIADVTYSTPSKGKIANDNWNVGDLAPGERAQVWVEGTVTDAAAKAEKITNRVIVHNPFHPKTPEDACEVNSGDVTTDGDQCDIVEDPVLPFSPPKVDKNLAIDPTEVALAPGRQVEYTITVTNDAESSGTRDINLVDHGGKYLKDVELLEASAGTIEGATLTYPRLSHGEVITVKARATLTDDYRGQEIVNTVTVGGEGFPPPPPENCVPNDNAESDTDQCDKTPFTPKSKIQIDKVRVDSDGNPVSTPVMPGEKVTYKITAKNAGPHAVANVSSDDMGGKFLENVTYSAPSKGKVNGDVWTIGDMVSGETQTATVTVDVSPKALGSKKIDNTVIIKSTLHPKDKTTKGNPNANVDEDDDQWDKHEDPLVPPSVPRIDKKLTSDPAKVALSKGNTLEYVYTVKADPEGAGESGVVVNDLGGPLLENIVLSEPTKGEVKGTDWLVGFLTPGETHTIKVSGTLKEDAGSRPVTNAVVVRGDHFTPPPSTNDDPGNPPTDCEANPDVDADKDGCDFETIKENTKLKIDKVRISDAKDLVVVDGVRTAPESARAKTPVREGHEITYLITVHNAGPSAASKVSTKDLGDVEFGSLTKVGAFDPSAGMVNEDGSWFIGDMVAGETQTIIVKGTVVAHDGVKHATNNAVVGNPNLPHPDPKKNEQCVINGVVVEDTDQCDRHEDPILTKLQVDKKFASENPDLSLGATVEFLVTARATGGIMDKNVVAHDLGGSHFKDVKFIEVPEGTKIDGDKWLIGDLAAGTTLQAKVSAVVAKAVTAGEMATNTVIITGDDNPRVPPTPGNNVPGENGEGQCVANSGDVATDDDQCDIVGIGSNPDLRIDKVRVKSATNHTVETGKTQIGAEIFYTIEVANMPGKDITTAFDVVAKDIVDEGLTDAKIVSATQGTFKGVEWMVGTLKPGDRAKAVVSAKVSKVGADRTVVNRAIVWNPVIPSDFDPKNPGKCQINDGVEKDTDRCDLVPTPVADPPAPPKPLAKTGADSLGVLVGISSALVMAGAGALAARRRRNDDQIAA